MPVQPSSTQRDSRRGLAVAAVGFTVLTWGYGSVAIAAASITGILTSFYRLWLAIPILWAIVVFVPTLRSKLTKAWLIGCLAGGGLFALHQILFFSALKLTSVADVTIIGALQPALVLMVAGRFFGERASVRGVVWSFVALVGVTMVVFGSVGTPAWGLFGDALAVVNLFAFTAYFLVSKRVRDHVGASEYVIGITTVAGIVLAIVAVATQQEFSSPTPWDWVIVASVAVLPGTTGHFLTNWAHPHLSAFTISMMILAVPVLAVVGAAVFLAETISWIEGVGGAVVLVSIGFVIASVRGRESAESADALDEMDSV